MLPDCTLQAILAAVCSSERAAAGLSRLRAVVASLVLRPLEGLVELCLAAFADGAGA